MSYILEALKKSEQARKQAEIPDINTVQDIVVESRTFTPAIIIVMAMLLLIAGLLLWLIMKEDKTLIPAPIIVKSAVVAPEKRETNIKVVEKTSAKPQVKKAVITVSQVVKMLPPKVIEKPKIVAKPIIEPMLSSMQKNRDPYAQVLLWGNLPASLRASLPYPKLDVHVYAQDAKRRFILVNLEKYREREQLAEGPFIEAIIVDGVVFSYKGERYKILRP